MLKFRIGITTHWPRGSPAPEVKLTGKVGMEKFGFMSVMFLLCSKESKVHLLDADAREI